MCVGLFFLFELDDGFGGGVVDVEFLGDLRDKRQSYIDDGPSFLNAVEQFGADLLSHLLVFFCCRLVLHVEGLQLVADQ
jgi:hypothetical protein